MNQNMTHEQQKQKIKTKPDKREKLTPIIYFIEQKQQQQQNKANK